MTLPVRALPSILPVVGLVSAFAEESLGIAAARSLQPACDRVYVAEGPVGDPEGQEPSRWPSLKATHVEYGAWDSDAAKRTHLLKQAQHYTNGRPHWIVWLDADELLISPEHLGLWIARAEAGDPDLRSTGGFYLRRVDLDGQVYQCPDRVLRGDTIQEYVHSIVEVRLKGQETSISLGHVPCWRPGDEVTGYNRPPLAGEPHILHLHTLRDPARSARRLSDDEVKGYRDRAVELGIAIPDWANA